MSPMSPLSRDIRNSRITTAYYNHPTIHKVCTRVHMDRNAPNPEYTPTFLRPTVLVLMHPCSLYSWRHQFETKKQHTMKKILLLLITLGSVIFQLNAQEADDNVDDATVGSGLNHFNYVGAGWVHATNTT